MLCAIMNREQWGEAPPCDDLTIEHIMPQKTDRDLAWPIWASGQRWVHEQYLHRLGNLTLCGGRWGSALSNRPFEEKKAIYYGKSGVHDDSTAIGSTSPKWDEAAIKRRAGRVNEEACRQLWPWTGSS